MNDASERAVAEIYASVAFVCVLLFLSRCYLNRTILIEPCSICSFAGTVDPLLFISAPYPTQFSFAHELNPSLWSFSKFETDFKQSL
jgi:hypothetical protein